MIRSRRRQLARRAGGSRFQRWIIPAIGALTPVGLIVVNIAVFIVNHLAAFRWTITVLAFVSGMMLNSWFGLKIYRLFKRRYQDHALSAEGNQDVVLIVGMLIIIIFSFVTAVFCYLGLNDEKNLPNRLTFITGVAAILIPLTAQAIFKRALGEGDSAQTPRPLGGQPRSVLPPPPPPSSSSPPPMPAEGTWERRP